MNKTSRSFFASSMNKKTMGMRMSSTPSPDIANRGLARMMFGIILIFQEVQAPCGSRSALRGVKNDASDRTKTLHHSSLLHEHAIPPLHHHNLPSHCLPVLEASTTGSYVLSQNNFATYLGHNKLEYGIELQGHNVCTFFPPDKSVPN